MPVFKIISCAYCLNNFMAGKKFTTVRVDKAFHYLNAGKNTMTRVYGDYFYFLPSFLRMNSKTSLAC
jgi:hypothetical protein